MMEEHYYGSELNNQNFITESEEDENYDLDANELAAFTQAFSQYPQDDNENASDDEDEQDGYQPLDLTQEDLPQEPPSPKRQKTPFYKDTKDRVSVDIRDGNQIKMRIFKKGEFFRKSTSLTHFYQIESFLLEGLTKKADCRLYIPLKETCLQEESGRIKAKCGGMNYVVCRFTECVRLKDLGELCGQPPFNPRNCLYYDTPKGESGLNVAFESSRGSARICLEGKPIALDLFAGVGGMSTGLEEAGFDVRWLVEQEPITAATLECNHPKAEAIFDEDVDIFLKRAKAGAAGYPQKGRIEHIHASSPCNGFSRENRNGGKHDQYNNDLIFTFVEAVKHFESQTGTLENVTGLGLPKHYHYVRKLLADFIIAGYQVRLAVLNSSHYGDAQARNRVFLFVAKNCCELPLLPPATHGIETGKKQIRTVKDVLGDLENVAPEMGSGLVKMPDGKLINGHILNDTVYSERKKLDPDKPAPTVTGKNGVEHYSLDRSLTIREFARIQSFPDWYRFYGGHVQKRKQIGNAVPINLATAVGKSVMASYATEFFHLDDECESKCPPDPRRVSVG